MTDIEQAVTFLQRGDLVGLPTETVYGLAGDATSTKVIAKIYAAKGRPTFNPLIIHSYDLQSIAQWVELHDRAQILAEHFWPGPLTLVLRRRHECPIDLLASAGLATLAVRIPSHPIARELLKTFDKPLAAPSANLSNRISPTSKAMVEQDFPELFVLEGGTATIGLESTIIGFEPHPVLYRPGGIALEDIEKIIGPLARSSHQDIQAPGMLKKHYAPHHKLRLKATHKEKGEVLLGFGYTHDADLNLSPSGNLVEAAANIYQMLHTLDQRESLGIAVAPIPSQGLGLAINDRLERAAA